MANIEIALKVAIESHAGQTDKGGQPYILHPLRLMHQCTSEEEKIVAVLHDVVEDSQMTISALEALGFTDTILAAIAALTKQPSEDYSAFIQRVASNPLARKIKIIDIQDNLDITRLPKVSDKDLARIKKYHQALHTLQAVNT